VPIHVDAPQEVGANGLCDIVAGLTLYGAPVIVVNFGTATTFDCVNGRGEFIGGAIAPGLVTASEALISRTSRLFRVELLKPKEAIGRNTATNIQSGLTYGWAGLVDGLVERMRSEMGAPVKVVATGGLADQVRGVAKSIDAINPNEVDISWELCGRRFQIPIMAAAMDGVVSPKLAIEIGRLGGLAVLNLEGIFSRYENPDEVLDRITSASLEEATKIIQGIYGEPIKEELIHKRVSEIKKGGGPVVVSSIPQRAERFAKIAEEAGADFFVVQSTVTTARHIATEYKPMDLRQLKKHLSIPLIVGNVVTYEACLELMECGVDALLIGVGPG